MGSNGSVRVLLVDDHVAFLDALEALLGDDARIRVVGRATNGEEGARLAAELDPDVVLMDISMPVLDGFGAAELIREQRPDTCVVFLTGSAAPADVDRARSVGASGYVTKDQIAGDLVETILAAAPPCAELS